MMKRIMLPLSLLYLALLVYNLFAAQFLNSAISLLLFLLTCPYLFTRAKTAYPAIDKIAMIAGWIPLVYLAAHLIAGSAGGNSDEIPQAEQAYIDAVLSQITAETTKEEAIELLGTPSRDLIAKVNWWVSIDNKRSRVGVYFSADTGKAEAVVLDGGWGKFYYRKGLIE